MILRIKKYFNIEIKYADANYQNIGEARNY